MIEAQSISFSYGGKVLLEEANFRIAKNQKVGLVGPNGAGKSTLLKLILDIEKKDFMIIKNKEKLFIE